MAALKIGEGGEYSKPRFAAPQQDRVSQRSRKDIRIRWQGVALVDTKTDKAQQPAFRNRIHGRAVLEQEGALRINIDGETWEWTQASGWQSLDYVAEPNACRRLKATCATGKPHQKPRIDCAR
jgi:hypothetical protein